MKPTLVIMAAGIGSRFGGIKQIEHVGPNGEILIDYSIYDAVRAGFRKLVFIVKPEILEDVKELCRGVIELLERRGFGPIETRYVLQDSASIPDFYKLPDERTKPLGTVHAVLCARAEVEDPFLVINADDYYGPESYIRMFRSVCALASTGEASMSGYRLDTTLSLTGSVTRGVCRQKDGYLEGVTETYGIRLFPDGTIRDEEGSVLDPDSTVSMNVWGMTPWVFGPMRRYFEEFLHALPEGELKRECLLPNFVDAMLSSGELRVKVEDTQAAWFGLTCREDVPLVAAALRELARSGQYEPLR